MACHTIGDAALDLVLDALEDATTGGPYPAGAGTVPRHRIEHGVMVRPDQVARLARLRMTVVVQPLFVREFGDPLLALPSGDDGGGNFFRMRSLMDAGVAVVGSSDRPVAAGSPLSGIQAMVERRTATGQVFGSGECLTPTEALASYTIGGAHAAHAESAWGAPSPAAWPTWSCWMTTPLPWRATGSVTSAWWRRWSAVGRSTTPHLSSSRWRSGG